MEEEIKNKSGKKKVEMSFLDHLEELRWHIIRSILAILLVSIVAFIFKKIIFDEIIFAPRQPGFFTNEALCNAGKFLSELLGIKINSCINSEPFVMQSIKMAGQFTSHIIVSFVAGFIVSFPYVFWEFWRFIVPALYEKEKKVAGGAVVICSLLFMSGVLFGYFLIVPLSIDFLGGYKVSEQVTNQIHLNNYIQTITSIVLAAGVVFELPVVIYFLSKIGLVTPDFLKKYRKHSLVIILSLSAIITPPDIFSQILVALPLMFLYEIGILISRSLQRKHEREQAEND